VLLAELSEVLLELSPQDANAVTASIVAARTAQSAFLVFIEFYLSFPHVSSII